MRRIDRFRRLPPAERRLVVLGAGLLLLTRLVVRVAGVPRARRVAGRLAPRSAVLPPRLAELLRGASQALPGGTRCLARAIVLEALLVSAGHPAELRVGVAPRRGRTRVDAHAWVEIDGRAVGEDPSSYQALPLFGARA